MTPSLPRVGRSARVAGRMMMSDTIAVATLLTCGSHALHVSCMAKMIQIRHVPDALHRTLRARAARSGMTLSDYLRTELARIATQVTPDELRQQLAALVPVSVREPPARVLRRERDRA